MKVQFSTAINQPKHELKFYLFLAISKCTVINSEQGKRLDQFVLRN